MDADYRGKRGFRMELSDTPDNNRVKLESF